MIVIDQNAEAKLRTAVERSRMQPRQLRCLYIHSLSGSTNALAVIEALNRRLPSNDAMVYLCEDSEVVVLAEGVSARDARTIADLLGPQISVEFFELVQGWSRVHQMVEDKLAIIAARENALEAQVLLTRQERERQAILNAGIEPELLATLADRRRRHSRSTVMIIEDDPFTRRLLEDALDPHCSVSLLGQGAEAVADYVIRAPHMLLLDINLPDINGHDLLRRINALDPDAFVVMLSGSGDRHNVLRAVQEGAKGFIGKPFSRDKLYQYLRRCPGLPEQKESSQ